MNVGFVRSDGSVVDVRWRVSVGESQRMLVRAHQFAVWVPLVTGAAMRRGDYHAALPGAVGLDGSIALAGNEPSVLAAGAGRRRRGDQPSGHQQDGQSSDYAVSHGRQLNTVWPSTSSR
jgi:hypothetical protein